MTIWATDEHRLGLLPVVRRIGAPRGQRPTAPVRRRSEWLDVYGFVRPRTGQTWWCLLPTVNTEAFGLALVEFGRDEGIGPTQRAVLVDRCRTLEEQRRSIKTRTRYHWWLRERRKKRK